MKRKESNHEVWEIAPDEEGAFHDHLFDQFGALLEGQIEMLISEEKKLPKAVEAYSIPAGIKHNWKALSAFKDFRCSGQIKNQFTIF